MGRGALCGSRGGGGTENKEGECPKGNPDDSWNVFWGRHCHVKEESV